jgi:hypothetical protein
MFGWGSRAIHGIAPLVSFIPLFLSNFFLGMTLISLDTAGGQTT